MAEAEILNADPRPTVLYAGSIGRPSFDVSREQLTYLIENQFTVPQIAEILCVSKDYEKKNVNLWSLYQSMLFKYKCYKYKIFPIVETDKCKGIL